MLVGLLEHREGGIGFAQLLGDADGDAVADPAHAPFSQKHVAAADLHQRFGAHLQRQGVADLQHHQLLERNVGLIQHRFDRNLGLRHFGRKVAFPDRITAELFAHEHLQQNRADRLDGGVGQQQFDIAAAVFHVDAQPHQDRGGNIELLLPYATIEPIRSVLLQMFMGEKFGRDPIWEGHFATEVAQAEISVDAVLYEADIPLRQLMTLKVGDTLPLEMKADALVAIRCGSVTLTEGRMGRVGDRVAIRVSKQLRKPNTTLAMFERADEQTKMMEAQ